MRVQSIDHLVLTTGDLAACLAFYCGILGMEHREAGGRHSLVFGTYKINIHTRAGEFQPAAAYPACGSLDLCLAMRGGMEAALRELEARGQPVLAGPVARQGACGPIQSIYLRDPDGNLVELAWYPPRGEPRTSNQGSQPE